MDKPSNLTNFLSGFQYTAPALSGDLGAIERIAWEFCEDAAHNGFCPHLLLPESRSGQQECFHNFVIGYCIYRLNFFIFCVFFIFKMLFNIF
jgi:hypothetical protein